MSAEPGGAGEVGTLWKLLDTESELSLLRPPPPLLYRLVDVGQSHHSLPTVSVLADWELLRSMREEFMTAARAANLVADGTLELRECPETAATPVVVGDEAYAPLFVEDSLVVEDVTDSEFPAEARSAFQRHWDGAEEFPLRTPPLDRVIETAGSRLGSETRGDLVEGLTAADEMRNPTEFDEVTAVLIVAARNGELLYDVSRWAEEVGLSSTATVSRRKTSLEERGVIETVDVRSEAHGRVRQQLALAEAYEEIADSNGIGDIVVRLAE